MNPFLSWKIKELLATGSKSDSLNEMDFLLWLYWICFCDYWRCVILMVCSGCIIVNTRSTFLTILFQFLMLHFHVQLHEIFMLWHTELFWNTKNQIFVTLYDLCHSKKIPQRCWLRFFLWEVWILSGNKPIKAIIYT